MDRRVGREDLIVHVLRPCLWPFDDMTPMTLNGWLRMRMTWPTGSASAPKSCSLTVVAEHRDLGGASHILRLKKRPLVVGHARMSGRSTSVPWMRVNQFWLPATTCVSGLDAGGEILHARNLVRDRLGIVDGERGRRARARRVRRPA